MSNKIKRNNSKKTESMVNAFRDFFGYLLNGMISVYMFLIIAVMPFYNQEGFKHIGSDKATFFRNVSVNGAKLILPTLAIYLVLRGVEYYREKGFDAKVLWKKFCKSLSLTDVFALIYGLSLILSYLFTDYKEQAAWGADGWYMGFWPQMILLGIYFLVSKCWTVSKWLVALFLPVSAVVFGLGYLNRFKIYPIDMKLNYSGFLSTVGNINWYCGYLVSVFFGGVYLLWQSSAHEKISRLKRGETIWQVLLVIYVTIGFASLITQGSMSGLLALGMVFFVMFCMSLDDGRRMQMFWLIALILAIVCMGVYCHRNAFGAQITFNDSVVDLFTDSKIWIVVAIVIILILAGLACLNGKEKYPVGVGHVLSRCAVGTMILIVGIGVVLLVMNTMNPGSIGALSEQAIFTFSDTWGSNRGATWKAGWMCFAEQDLLHKLIGSGPDCMSAFLYREGSAELVEMVRALFGSNTLTNAHGEWLTILVNEGILGLVGFVGMMCSAVVRFLKCGNGSEKKETTGKKWLGLICGACGLCVLAYTANNIFSFQQSMNTATIFVVLGIGEACARKINIE